MAAVADTPEPWELPVGSVYPEGPPGETERPVVSGHGVARGVEPPWEVADMEGFLGEACLSRYRAGHEACGDATCHKSPLATVGEAVEEVADALFYLRQATRLLAPRHGRLRIYIAGPYRADTVAQRDRNITQARLAAAELLRRGHAPFCPHTMTAEFDDHFPDLPDTCYLVADLDWLTVAHAVLILPGWTMSEGTLAEKAAAERLGLPLYYRIEDVPSLEEVRRQWPPAKSGTAATR
jgi:hypothetical protein